MIFPLKKRKFINFKSTFTKLIVSYILLSFLILNISTLTLYQGYKNQIIEQSNSVYNKLLTQANYYTQNTLNWANSFVYQLYLDDNIYNLMYNSHIHSATESIGISKIEQASSVVPLTQSIYIYNNNLKMFYSSLGTTYSVNDFYDQGIVSILKGLNSLDTSKFIARKIHMPNKTTDANVLTIILSTSTVSDNGLPDGAIILNLNAKEIGNYFKDISNSSNDLFAVDNKGMIILNSNTGVFYQDISSKHYIQRILSSKEKQGNFIENINGVSCIINFMTSERSNLKYINITPYQTLLESTNKMFRLLIIIFLSLSILGILFSYIFSRNIYSPIERIIKYVKKNMSLRNFLEKNENKNDLDYLSDAISRILNTSLSLKNLSTEDSLFIKQKILKDLLTNSLNNVKQVEEKLPDLNICLNPNNLLIFVLRIDSYKDVTSNYSNENMELFLYTLSNISYEVTSSKYSCEVVAMNSYHIAIILNIEDEALSQATNSIIQLIRKIQEIILSSLHFSVTAGIGNFASNLSDLPKSYKWAYEYTNYKIKYGPNSILYYDKVIAGIKENYIYPEEKEKILFTAIKSRKLEDVEIALSNILEEFLNCRHTDMVLYIMQLSSNSKKLLNSLIHDSDENLLISSDFFKETLEKSENIIEIKDWLMASYRHTLLQLQETKEHKKDKLVNKVISYIEINYENPALSPENLADYVKISPNYLRSIFKEIRNQSLSNFINEYRFEKSKHLLQTTDLPVNDISAKIGFTNTNYFYTSFKKYYGVSPTEWRKELKNKNA